jgi:hypothetical protein
MTALDKRLSLTIVSLHVFCSVEFCALCFEICIVKSARAKMRKNMIKASIYQLSGIVHTTFSIRTTATIGCFVPVHYKR